MGGGGSEIQIQAPCIFKFEHYHSAKLSKSFRLSHDDNSGCVRVSWEGSKQIQDSKLYCAKIMTAASASSHVSIIHWLCVCVCVCVHACLCVCVCACMHVCAPVCM